MIDKGAKPVLDDMVDCGDGRHVGLWKENYGNEPAWLLIEVTKGSVLFSCRGGADGERRRQSFIASHGTALEIAMALARALGVELDEGLQDFANRMQQDFESRGESR